MPTIDLKILDPRLQSHLPAYATAGSAGLDLRAAIDSDMVIAPGETQLVPTGIAIHLEDPGFAAMILPRSLTGNSSTSLKSTWTTGTTTICAMRSSGARRNAS